MKLTTVLSGLESRRTFLGFKLTSPRRVKTCGGSVEQTAQADRYIQGFFCKFCSGTKLKKTLSVMPATPWVAGCLRKRALTLPAQPPITSLRQE